jgi:uncharacterized membrane protein (UPF0127 family)
MSKNENSEIKSWQVYILVLIILTTIGLKLYQSFYWPKAQIKINDKIILVLVADNFKHWQKGLGGRNSLGKYKGMLFIFPDIKRHVFVMRDMKFPIDIIWIKNNLIVDFASNVPTEYEKTEAELTPYLARADSDMVLELPAGTALNWGLKIGDKIEVVR